MSFDPSDILRRSAKTHKEALVIASIIGDPRLGRVATSSLKAHHFIDPRHKRIFEAIEECVRRGEQPSEEAIKGHFTDSEISLFGGREFLSEFRDIHHDPQNISRYIKSLREETVRRSLVKGLTQIVRSIDGQVPTDRAIRDLSVVLERATLSVDDEDGRIESVYDQLQGEDESPGIETGFGELDACTGGMKPGTLWAVSAYASTGKTFWIVKVINNVQLSCQEPCLFFSLEMTPTRIIRRVISDLVNRGERADKVKEFKLHIFNKKRTLHDIEYAIIAYKPKIIFIDYVQLIESKQKDEYNEMRDISRQLQRMAQEHECCIVVASQVPNDYAKAPSAFNADFMAAKGGGNLPAACDVFVELFRDAREIDETRELHGRSEITMAVKKNRDGRRARLNYYFDNDRAFITDGNQNIPTTGSNGSVPERRSDPVPTAEFDWEEEILDAPTVETNGPE